MLSRKHSTLDPSLVVKKGAAQPMLTVVTRSTRFSEPRPARAPHDTVSATVRMSEDLYLKLRLFAAHTRRSRQDIFRAAIEAYIGGGQTGVADCACLEDADGSADDLSGAA